VFESVRPPYKIRPEGLTPIPAQGLLLSNGLRTLLPSGTEQNFVFELRNNDGTLEHRFVSDSATGGTPVGASQINGASPTFSATPGLRSCSRGRCYATCTTIRGGLRFYGRWDSFRRSKARLRRAFVGPC
jgi:hypothetical protein